MKRLLIVSALFFTLLSCNSSDQGGVVNDGIKTIDENGALSDTLPPTVDTLNENRVDIQQRDTVRP